MTDRLTDDQLRDLAAVDATSLRTFREAVMATELLELRRDHQATMTQRDDLQDELGRIRSILYGDDSVDDRTTEQVARDLVRDKAELIAHTRQLRTVVAAPPTDPTPLCPVCGCGVVDDLETTAAGVYAHGECLGEAAMLTAISDRDREIDDLRGRLGRAEGGDAASWALAVERKAQVDARDRRIAELEAQHRVDTRQVASEIVAHLDKLAGPEVVTEAREYARETAAERDALRDRVTELESELAEAQEVRGDVTARIIADRDARIGALESELEHRDLFQLEVNRQLREAVDARDAAEIKSEESRRRVDAAEAELNTVRAALESRVLLDVLDDAEVRGKIATAAADAAREMLTALGIDLDAPPPAREPDGWIMGQLHPTGYEKARELLDSARRLYPGTEARLYEVREVRS